MKGWGKSIVQILVKELQKEFPGAKGYSAANLWRMRNFYLTYRNSEKLAPQVREISWGNNIAIMEKCKDDLQREFYIQMTKRFGWTKRILINFIEAKAYEKYLLNQTNFDLTIPDERRIQAKLAVKDEYMFDFAELSPEYSEHELELQLVNHIRAFLIEMGGDFSFLGNQYHLVVGNHDLYIDLLLFHRRLRSLVAMELKIGEFEAEYAGKMQLYLTALDEQIKLPDENPSIGIIICKSKDRTYVEYALKRSNRYDEDAIGEKGHGTKVFFNSKKIDVATVKDGKKYHAIMKEPKRELFNQQIPQVDVCVEDVQEEIGTVITIYGYNNNRRDKFTHEQLKDYILWFTKIGSVETEFGIKNNSDIKLRFKGIDHDEFEELKYGHIFPKESKKVSELFDEHMVDAPKWYCKKILKTGSLKNMPEVKYQAVFYIEGTKVKYGYNPMIRRSGHTAPEGSYTVQDRYGIWICKDFMPIQRKNEWITSKGSEYTKFHAFINCQGLRLTANRGSIENTPSEILHDLKDVVKEIYDDIVQSDDWNDLEWLESEAGAYNTVEKEKRDFKRRIDKVNRTRIAQHNGINLVEPQQENGVFSIFMQLSNYNLKLFPFTIVDYDTHSGIDVIVKAQDKMPIKTSKLYYVEFKNYLGKEFNHSFENIHSIVCWDINLNELRNNEEVKDIANERRTLKIVPPENDNDYTRYYLDSLRNARKIEVFVLKYYFKEKLNIDFIPRTDASII